MIENEVRKFLKEKNYRLFQMLELQKARSSFNFDYQDICLEYRERSEEIILQHKIFPRSRIKVSGNVAEASAGTRSPLICDDQSYNEFLMVLMPDMKYIIDEGYIFKTDYLARLTTAWVHIDKNMVDRNLRARSSLYQKETVLMRDGVEGDESGHMIQMGLGGPNELINQVPQLREINRAGIWRIVEKAEEQLVYYNEPPIAMDIKRTVLYKGNSLRPSGFVIEDTIDGVPFEVNGERCPIVLENG